MLARLNSRLGQGYVVLSGYLEGIVRRHGTRLPVHRIPVYGVNTSDFRPANGDKEALKAERDLPATGRLLLTSSRVAPEKDTRTLLLALRQLLSEGEDLWLLHRSGGYHQFLAEAQAAGVAQRIIATDAVHPSRELPRDYQAADLYVQASLEEGLGFAPLEAMACGTPVVATAVGGLCETVREGETGWTYPRGESSGLAATIKRALADPAECARRAGLGQRQVQEEFEAGMVFDRLSQLLDPRFSSARAE
jgi:glycosyltransferase involved in cell wall biosynthesis